LLLEWLANTQQQPEFVVFPECSVPFECLGLIKKYSERTGTVFFAGTHTPRSSAISQNHYRKILGVANQDVKGIFRQSSHPKAVLPIICPDRSYLIPKQHPSIFEMDDIDSTRAEPLAPVSVSLGSRSIRISPLICSEALQLQSWNSPLPQLIVVLARDRHPNRYHKRIATWIENKLPVAFANDGSMGGSGIFAAIDQRRASWWFAPPNNGTLPHGEAFLHVELDLDSPAVQVAVSAPATPVQLLQVAPVLTRDNELLADEQVAFNKASNGDSAALLAMRQHLDKAATSAPLVSRRWDFLESLVAEGTLSDGWLNSVGQHITTQSLVQLSALEQQLANTAISQLQPLLETAADSNMPVELIGLLSKTLHSYQKSVARKAEDTRSHSLPQVPILPIGRSEVIGDIRGFATKSAEPICFVNGLEAVGKSTVISAALQQATSKNIFLDCLSGTSADFLFEYLITAAGRVPPGMAPRIDFPADDIADALNSFDMVWFHNTQNAFDSGKWRTIGLQQFFDNLLIARQRTKTKIILESRRNVLLNVPLGVQVLRRPIKRLLDEDAVALFDQQLRRAGVPIDTITDQDKSKVAHLTDGHPGLLILCADACAAVGIEKVIADLQKRSGFYLAAIQRLVNSIGLTELQAKLLEGLIYCRLPVPSTVFSTLGATEVAEALSDLVHDSLIERLPESLVQVTSLLRNCDFLNGSMNHSEIKTFHTACSEYYVAHARSSSILVAYRESVEANFHAALAGIKLPCTMSGLIDGLSAAARQEYDAQRYLNVVRFLGHLSPDELPEDLLAALADSYAWNDQFEDAFRLANLAVARNREYIQIYWKLCRAALHSRRWEFAERAIASADAHEPGSYLSFLYRGRLDLKDSRYDNAIDNFKESARRSERDPWPYFYWARTLLRRGLPEECIEAIGEALTFLSKRGLSKGNRECERAVLTIQLHALLLTGHHEPARRILEILEKSEESRPETILSAAFVRAYYDGGGDPNRILGVFDDALSRLAAGDSRRAHTRAQIALFRGKICEQMGDLKRATDEYERACSFDPHNVYMKVALSRLLMIIARNAKAELDHDAARSTAFRALEIVKMILNYDANHRYARDTQEDIFNEFGLQ
jgi:tetratricopeptide (TPR) repeat protein